MIPSRLHVAGNQVDIVLEKVRVVCVTRAGLSFENGLRKQKALV